MYTLYIHVCICICMSYMFDVIYIYLHDVIYVINPPSSFSCENHVTFFLSGKRSYANLTYTPSFVPWFPGNSRVRDSVLFH